MIPLEWHGHGGGIEVLLLLTDGKPHQDNTWMRAGLPPNVSSQTATSANAVSPYTSTRALCQNPSVGAETESTRYTEAMSIPYSPVDGEGQPRYRISVTCHVFSWQGGPWIVLYACPIGRCSALQNICEPAVCVRRVLCVFVGILHLSVSSGYTNWAHTCGRSRTAVQKMKARQCGDQSRNSSSSRQARRFV